MAISNVRGLDAALRGASTGIRVILIYGADAAVVRELVLKVVRKFGNVDEDPFAVAVIEDSVLASDPGRLPDEVESMSLTGGGHVVWVRNADGGLARALPTVLTGSRDGNLIVAESGLLPKNAALRGLLEASDRALVVPVYEANGSDIKAMIEELLALHGKRIGPVAMERLVEVLGGSTPVLRQEVEKLLTFVGESAVIEQADVDAICCDSGAGEVDAVVDAAFAGEVEKLDGAMERLFLSGFDPGRLLASCHSHAVRLGEFAASIERGESVEAALRSARPPLFFKRMQLIASVLRIWDVSGLHVTASRLAAAVSQTRSIAHLAPAVASRSIMAVARDARSRRQRVN